MTDKILTEAFDKLKAIEESDDPFCIGATKEDEVTEAYTEVVEADNDAWQDGQKTSLQHDEAPDARAEDKTYSFEDDNGNNYVLEIQTERGGKERGFVEVNGITVATFDVGGAGSMSARIQKPDEVMNMLAAAMQKANGSY